MQNLSKKLQKFIKNFTTGGSTDKRVRIAKIQQHMMLSVAATSIVFGICLVLSIHFIQHSIFNTKVLTEEDAAIEQYSSSLINSGACIRDKKSGSNDDVLSTVVVDKCKPNETPLEETSGSLRNIITLDVANNKDLESVVGGDISSYPKDCLDSNKKPINFTKLYEQATSEADRELYLSLVKMCSSLRVIPDALPSQKNDEALMSSLNKIFIMSGWQPESLSPSDSSSSDSSENSTANIFTMPLSLAIEGDANIVGTVLTNTELSIRAFNPTTATISWSAAGIELKAEADAYYTGIQGIQESTKTVRASNSKGGK